MSVSIAPVRSPEDLEAALALFRAYAKSLGIDLAHQDFEGELAAMPGKYGPPDGDLLLARDADDTPVGCVGLRPIEPDGCCEMKRLYVPPSGRGQGTGKALVGAVLGLAARLGYREIRLDTLPTMPEAISLYKNAGFDVTAPYYDTPIDGTIFLARQLGTDNNDRGE